MLRRTFALILVLALAAAGAPSAAAASGIKQNLGTIQGTIVDDAQKGIPSVCVQLRNVDTGQVSDKTTTDSEGRYEFRDVKVGSYVVEATNCSSAAVLALSSTLAITAGAAPVSGVVVALGSAAVAAMAAGAGFFSGTVAAVLIAGVGAGVVAVAAARTEASPK